MPVRKEFMNSVMNLEKAMANTLNAVVKTGHLDYIERITKRMIQKELVLESLFNKIN
ncbi:hypothetical protein [Cerasibacillus sp.]|uniref:hypothetical protein n=1 Tax=Cerasibacillus sp. TaxID=2498711 RepID=UPI002F3FB73F